MDEKQFEMPFQVSIDGKLLKSEPVQISSVNLYDLIKLQSILRGYLNRKQIHSMRLSLESNFLSSIQQQKRLPIQEVPSNELPEFFIKSLVRCDRSHGKFDLPTICIQNLNKKGYVELEDAAIYHGQWNELNQREGAGVQVWPDGSVYQGLWMNDKANGYGRLVHADGDVYIGNWKDGKTNGYGEYVHANGAKYSGDWKNDKHDGKGIETWPDGAKYEGLYIDGKKEGLGTFLWGDGSKYEGEFKDNCIHGIGKYSWSDGRTYVGEWKVNKMDGRGEFWWSDGRRYKGEYFNDKKHGFGVFEWTDNRQYEGGWLNGKQHGKGVYTTAEGIAEGEWKHGKRVKIDQA